MVTRKNAFYSDREGNIDAEAWLNHIAVQRPESRLRLIRHAIALSQLISGEKQTPLGISCLQQGLVMADLMLDLMMDEDTICAALLYHTVYYAELDLTTVEEQINPNVAKLLKGALRMNNMGHYLELKNIKQNQLEKFRKMLFSMADDMRVVFLKLSERIAWMRAVKQLNIRTTASRAYAQESLAIYASLANRLGIHVLRYELEDLAMEQLAPRLYKKIACWLKERLIDRESYLKELALAIEITLPKIGISYFKISSRVKNFYGTYRKMRQKQLAFHEVYDLNAIRIVVSTVEECYRVVEVIQTLWTPLPDGFDDYIKKPKGNNYRSIHLAVYGTQEKIIEIQVRTFEMDQESENGLAAHWEYKEDMPHKPGYHEKIAWLRQVITWQKELVRSGMYLMPELTAMLDDRVYVLTQTGDIIDLPKGATALDFAYHMHSEIGHYCEGVSVNNKSQPLSYVLNTGEQVAVFTGKKLNLSWDWLNPDLGYLNTTHARAKVLHWFQKKDYYQHIVTGQLLLEKGCRQLGIQFLNQDKLARELNFKSKQELLAALGSGELRIVQVLHALHPYRKNQEYSSRLEKPKPSLRVMEQAPRYEVSAAKMVEVQLVAAANTDILDTVLHLAREYVFKLAAVSAIYQPKEEHTYITLDLEMEDSSRLEGFMHALQRIENVVNISSNL